MAALIAACGPSGKDVATAKKARYQGDKIALFTTIKQTTEAKHKIDVSDESTLGMKTKGRWYTSEGMIAPGGDENMRDVPDRSIRVALVVRMLADGDSWIVEVTPEMVRYFAGRPNPDKLTPDDPSVPGWALGQAEQLQYEIYSALKPYEVKMPGLAPPPSDPAAPPAEQPPTPAPTAEPAGSAAPTAAAPTPAP